MEPQMNADERGWETKPGTPTWNLGPAPTPPHSCPPSIHPGILSSNRCQPRRHRAPAPTPGHAEEGPHAKKQREEGLGKRRPDVEPEIPQQALHRWRSREPAAPPLLRVLHVVLCLLSERHAGFLILRTSAADVANGGCIAQGGLKLLKAVSRAGWLAGGSPRRTDGDANSPRHSMDCPWHRDK